MARTQYEEPHRFLERKPFAQWYEPTSEQRFIAVKHPLKLLAAKPKVFLTPSQH